MVILSCFRTKAVDSARGSSLSVSLRSTPEQMETNYMDYLHEAQQRILCCAKACRNWSAPYDGELPPPDSDLGFSDTAPTKPTTQNSSLSGKTVKNASTSDSTKSASVPLGENDTPGKEAVKPEAAPVKVVPETTVTNSLQPEDSVPRQQDSVPTPRSASSPISDLSKCLDLESFLAYLNTVEVLSPSTPEEIEQYLEELDTLASDLPSPSATIEHVPSEGKASAQPVTETSDVTGLSSQQPRPDASQSSRVRSSTASSDRSSTSSIEGSARQLSSSGPSPTPVSTPGGATGKTPTRSSFLGAKYPSGTPNIGE